MSGEGDQGPDGVAVGAGEGIGVQRVHGNSVFKIWRLYLLPQGLQLWFEVQRLFWRREGSDPRYVSARIVLSSWSHHLHLWCSYIKYSWKWDLWSDFSLHQLAYLYGIDFERIDQE